MRLEAEAARRVALVTLLRDQGRVDLEEYVRERRAEVGAVNRRVARRLGRVDVLALCAVQLDALLMRQVREPDREQRVRAAKDARAAAKVALLVLFELGWSVRLERDSVTGHTIFCKPRVVMM